MADIDALKGSLKAYKGHVTRAIRATDRLCAFVDEHATSFNVKELEEAHSNLKAAFQKVEDCYIKLQELDPANFVAYDNGIRASLDEFDKVSDQVLKVLSQSAKPAPNTSAPPQQAGGGGGGHARPKINDTLKPFILTRDHNPTEFRSWVQKFRAFYSTSAIDKCAIAEQQAYLRICIDSNLDSRIYDKVQATTPIFGDDGCISLLEEEFMLRYPLFTRRLDFFRHTQSSGQLFSEFAAQLRQKGEEADLQHLTMDDIYVFRYICGTTDSTLKERFLKIEDPNLDKLKKEAHTYEVAAQALKAMGEKVATAAKVTNKSHKKQQYAEKKGRVSRDDLRGKCFRCGSSDHYKNCPREEFIVCKKCGKDGHLSSVCLRSSDNRSRPPSRSQSRNRRRSPSPSPKNEHKSNAVYSVYATRSSSTSRLPTKFCSESSSSRFCFNANPDTGTSKTIIGLDLMTKNRMPYKPDSDQKLYAANGQRMSCEGTAKIIISCQNSPEVHTEVLVSSDVNNEVLLGRPDLQQLGVISESFPHITVNNVKSAKCMDSLQHIMKDYPDVLSDTLGSIVIAGSPMQIHLRDDVDIQPKRILTARQIPLHLNEEANRVVEDLLARDVIEPVTVPTDWISPAHFVPKEGGKGGLRMVTDFTALNRYVKRPVHPFPSSSDIVQGISPASKYFAKLDAVQGYFQIPLDEDSASLTTFLLPSGRYRYKRAPMGLSASSDEWCLRSDAALHGLQGTKKLVDDILIEAPDETTLMSRTRAVLDRCREHGITISKKKLQTGNCVKFAGYIISSEGIKPDPEKAKAIKEFPVPHDVTSLRSFLGLANQLGHFLPDLAQTTICLRQLLKKGVAFTWLEEHQQEFDKVREILTSDLLIKPFDPTLRTELLTDASRQHGLGYALLQRVPDGSTNLIQCGSRSLAPAETRYATIELECQAIQWAMNKCRHYLMGMPTFTVVTDHRPLLGIFAKSLDQIDNSRLQRMREKMVAYTFEVKWNAGKDHQIADALSRAPVFAATDNEDTVNEVLCNAVASDPKLQPLFDAATDPAYQAVVQALRAGKHPRNLPPSHPARLYGSVWHKLSLFDDEEDTLLLYDNNRIVVPKLAREEILRLLHIPHAGQVKTRKAAQRLYFWPRINDNIKQLIESCPACQELRPSQQSEPLIQTEATVPMQQVAVDLFEVKGQHWLCMVDRFSGFPFARRLSKLHTAHVTDIMLEWFLDWGFPQVIRSDGGPQFRSAFQEFCKKHDIAHEVSSPYHPQSNGLAESTVKSVKYLLIKCKKSGEDFFTALSAWRNTPRGDGYSPAEMLFNRQPRCHLPKLEGQLVDKGAAAAARQRVRDAAKAYHDRQAKPLHTLHIGQNVQIQNPISKRWDSFGEIVSVLDNARSYVIQTKGGKRYTRNRRFLKTSDLPLSHDSSDDEPVERRRSARLAEKKQVRFDI